MRVAIVVAAHRHYQGMAENLQRLHQLLGPEDRLIFVDNGSPQALLSEWVADVVPQAVCLRNEENLLFTGGYNRGLRYALEQGFEFSLIVNADASPASAALLEELLAVASRWPRAAFVGPKVFFRSTDMVQNTQLHYPWLVRQFAHWTPYRVAPSLLRPPVATEREVEFLNGVCVLCRSSALREIGLMDDHFGGYVEDADWAWRARQLGWQSVFSPTEGVVHHEETSGYEHYSFKTLLLKRNTVLFLAKHGFLSSALSYAALSSLLAVIRWRLEKRPESRLSHESFLRALLAEYSGLLWPGASGSNACPPRPENLTQPLEGKSLM